MASMVPALEYDLFISYRQNDNQPVQAGLPMRQGLPTPTDGWVSEFVQHLERELKSVLKEPLTIYFDKNPYDGLLENHAVDKSLEGKLKCLIFIPVISQTYCDPNSFAWQHEFCAFNRFAQAAQGTLGRDVRLANGNVASRILPIQIHDLDEEDKVAVEREMGGALRAIQFIYREAGVNRPLRPDDDRVSNLNKTDYRNQVNKVANAIKEIVSAVRNPAPVKKQGEAKSIHVEKKSGSRKKLVLIAAAILLLGLAGYGFYFWKSPNLNDKLPQKSIAVLPFKNLSGSSETQYFADGVMEAILNHLSKIEDLKVISRTSMEPYRTTNKSIKEIADEVGVNHLLEGSVQRDNDKVRVTVQLINARTDDHIWAENYDKELKDIFEIQSTIAQSVAQELNITLKSTVKNSMQRMPTHNLAAYDDYLRGRSKVYSFRLTRDEADFEQGTQFLKGALDADSMLAPAYTEYAYAWGAHTFFRDYLKDRFFDSVLLLANKALAIDPNLSDGYRLRGLYYANVHSEFDQAAKEFNRAIELGPNQALNYTDFADAFFYETEIAMQNLVKGLMLDPNSPFKADLYRNLSWMYLAGGIFDKAEDYAKKSVDASSEADRPLNVLVHTYMMQGKIKEAVSICENWRKTSRAALRYLSEAYTLMNRYEDAEKCMVEYAGLYQYDNNYKQRYGLILWKVGKKEEARKILNEAIKEFEQMIHLRRQQMYGAYYDLAGIYALLGKKEEAYRYIAKWDEFKLNVGLHQYVMIDPFFESLRNEAPFRQAVEKQRAWSKTLGKRLIEISRQFEGQRN